MNKSREEGLTDGVFVLALPCFSDLPRVLLELQLALPVLLGSCPARMSQPLPMTASACVAHVKV